MLKLAAALVLLAAAAPAQSVEIVLATYGAGQLQDVTAVVQSALAAGKRELPVTLDALGIADPAPGRVKSLRVVYRASGALFETMADDFETLTLPTAARASDSGGATRVRPTTGGFFDAPGETRPAQGTAEPAAATPPAPSAVAPVASVTNGACLYTQANYGGTPYCYATGAAAATLGDVHRRFRSVRIVGPAEAVVLFDAANFLGASVRLTKSQPNLRTAEGAFYVTNFEDRAASLRVE